MKNLRKFIMEGIDNSLRSYLLELIKDMDDDELDQFNKSIVNSGRFAKLIETPPTKEQLLEFFKKKGIDDAMGLIMRIVKYEDYHKDKKLFYKIVKGQESNLPDSKKFIESTNVFDLFQSAGFSRKFLEEINELRPAKKTISRGPFEILCDLFITDVKDVANNSVKNAENGEGSGDVHTELCGALEFKADGARVQGHAPEGITIVNETFDKYISKLFPGVEFKMLNKGYFSAVGAITSITEQLLNAGCDFDTYIDILVECMTAQFPADKKDKDTLRQFLNKTNGSFFPRDLKLKFGMKKNSRKKDAPMISTGKIDTKDFDFTTLWGIIDMYFYHKREKWPYMIIFAPIGNNYGEYYVLDGKNCNDFEDIYNEVRSGNIYFEGLPGGNGFEAAVKIHKGSK